jgi:hypothetical protein
MSFAHRSMPAESDDDALRLAAARREAIAVTAQALASISLPPADRVFIVEMQRRRGYAEQLTERQQHALLQLAWHYRRQLPAHLAPKINPDDPLSPDRVVPLPWKDHRDGR